MASIDAHVPHLKHIPLSYNPLEPETSARTLLFALYPDWETADGQVEFVRFKEGITNTLFKAIKRRPGFDDRDIDAEAVLLRAYGNGTHVLIDREREAQSHSLLASFDLAPTLLARFENGLLYNFIAGEACSPEDMRRDEIWPATARLLGRWHGILPVREAGSSNNSDDQTFVRINSLVPHAPPTNIWSVMQKWILALPTRTKAERDRNASLQREVEASARLLGNTPGLDGGRYTLSHCDLLSGNIVILPSIPKHQTSSSQGSKEVESHISEVSFIDYEYTTPSPAAFDLANHFAEWGGFDCDYNFLPTRSRRRDFIRHYVSSYRFYSAQHQPQSSNGTTSTFGQHSSAASTSEDEDDVKLLADEVDAFRGMPGLYWGIWALIQAEISQIDFEYATYAETRLKEYWDWKAEVEGRRAGSGAEMPLRERRLVEE